MGRNEDHNSIGDRGRPAALSPANIVAHAVRIGRTIIDRRYAYASECSEAVGVVGAGKTGVNGQEEMDRAGGGGKVTGEGNGGR